MKSVSRFFFTEQFAGSGKSLIYQLPPLVMGKTAVIVGPLVSLANDQVEKLRKVGVEALLLNHQVRGSLFRLFRRSSLSKGAHLSANQPRSLVRRAPDEAPLRDSGEYYSECLIDLILFSQEKFVETPFTRLLAANEDKIGFFAVDEVKQNV